MFTLPAEPVDGYQIEWYEYSGGSYYFYIHHYTAKYYRNTPWDVYCPGGGNWGAPLVDDWMISREQVIPEKGPLSAESRWCGWSRPAEETDWTDCCLTLGEAVEVAKAELQKQLADKQRDIQRIELLLKNLEGIK
jgi:hypothetical protein